MRVVLYSPDRVIHQRCREIFRECQSVNWQLTVSEYDSSALVMDAGVYIWDVHPNMNLDLTEEMLDRAEHIFIVERQDLSRLREKLPVIPTRILLKPINAILLRSYLDELVTRANCGERITVPAETSDLQAERDELFQCLLAANVRLQEYDLDRSQFLYHTLHDFRTPLMAFDGYCDLLLDRKLGPLSPEQVNALQRMKQSVKRLSRLSASMLQLSAGDQSRMTARLQPEDIEECVAQAVHEVRPLVDLRKLQIAVQILPPPDSFWFDRTQVEQLLVNLLDNACRFSRKGGQIAIQGRPVFWDRRVPNLIERRDHSDRRRVGSPQLPNSYQIEVCDSGTGIPQAELENILRELSSTGSPHGGSILSGLGLAICKQIVNRHGGSITAETSPDGSRFVFVLPLTHPAAKGLSKAGAIAAQNSVRAVGT